MLEKIARMVMLKDFYGPLLTEKQQMVINLYYENDWSFSEIADDMQVSRQAIYDLLKRAENLLEDYEARLCLVEKFLGNRQQIREVYNLLNDEIDREVMEKALAILREVTESV